MVASWKHRAWASLLLDRHAPGDAASASDLIAGAEAETLDMRASSDGSSA